MTLWEAIQPWLDIQTGLMTASDGGKDNLILMSAYLLRELVRSGEIDAAHILLERMQIFLSACQVAPGLYLRAPGNTEQNSVDNLVGACAAGTEVAEAIRVRWNRHLSCFDVSNPNKFAINSNFYARFIGTKAYIVVTADKKPWFIQKWFWNFSVWWSIKSTFPGVVRSILELLAKIAAKFGKTVTLPGGASNPLLMSLQVDYMSECCPKVSEWWSKHYSIQNLYSQYFGPTFPLTTMYKS